MENLLAALIRRKSAEFPCEQERPRPSITRFGARRMSKDFESPAGTKRKSETEMDLEETSSPQRRGAGAVTLEAIAAMFAKQTKEIQEGTSGQITEALREFEEKTLKRMIDNTEERVSQMVKGQDGKIEELQKSTAALLERVKRLEDKPAPSSGGSTAEGGDRMAMVVGGWKADTHKDLILADLKSLAKELDLDQWLDGEHFVPGLRSSVAIVPFHPRQGETEHQARQRLNKAIGVIREARLQTQNLPEDGVVWAAVSRPKATRLLAAHAGKVRKCLYMLDVNARNSECEYSTGTVWLGSVLLASATRPTPKHDQVLEGRLANSWLDARAVANAVPCAVHRVQEAWKKCFDN